MQQFMYLMYLNIAIKRNLSFIIIAFVFQASARFCKETVFSHSKSFWHFTKLQDFPNQIPNYGIFCHNLETTLTIKAKFFPGACFSSKLTNEIFSAFKNIELAALNMAQFYTHRADYPFTSFLILKSLSYYLHY